MSTFLQTVTTSFSDIARRVFSHSTVLVTAGLASVILVAMQGFTPIIFATCIAMGVAAGILNFVFNRQEG